jgi:chitodextrinase
VSPNAEKNGVGYDKNAFLPTLGGSAESGTLFNQLINTHSYYLQSEWDNATSACLMRPAIASSFTSSPGPAIEGVPVGFSRPTDPYGVPTVSWTFGDGATGTGSTPSHTYAAPGSYEVKMTLKDELMGALAPVTRTIVVHDQPTASFSLAPSPATAGTPVGFDGSASRDPDGSIASYAWSFGDGTSGAGIAPSHAYSAAGTYTITLTITDSGGVATSISHLLAVAPAPVISAAAVLPAITPNSGFGSPTASFNQRTGVLTVTASVADPGKFSWLVTFQNGRFGVFAAGNAKCRTGFVRLGGRCRSSKIVFARSSLTLAAPGTFTLKLKPSASALKALRNALKQRKGLPLSGMLTFQSSRGGSSTSRQLSLTVKLKRR